MAHAVSAILPTLDEIGVKREAERIVTPGGAGDFGALFGEQRIVHGDDQRGGRTELVEQTAAGDGEQGVGVETGFGEQATASRPVLEPGAGGREQTGDGAAAQPDQQQGFDFLLDAALPALVEGLAERGERSRTPFI